jgi:hypothetical protein
VIQVAIALREVEMFQCVFAAFNASETLDVFKRVFFGSRSDGHLSRSESHCTIFDIVSMERQGKNSCRLALLINVLFDVAKWSHVLESPTVLDRML